MNTSLKYCDCLDTYYVVIVILKLLNFCGWPKNMNDPKWLSVAITDMTEHGGLKLAIKT